MNSQTKSATASRRACLLLALLTAIAGLMNLAVSKDSD